MPTQEIMAPEEEQDDEIYMFAAPWSEKLPSAQLGT